MLVVTLTLKDPGVALDPAAKMIVESLPLKDRADRLPICTEEVLPWPPNVNLDPITVTNVPY